MVRMQTEMALWPSCYIDFNVNVPSAPNPPQQEVLWGLQPWKGPSLWSLGGGDMQGCCLFLSPALLRIILHSDWSVLAFWMLLFLNGRPLLWITDSCKDSKDEWMVNYSFLQQAALQWTFSCTFHSPSSSSPLLWQAASNSGTVNNTHMHTHTHVFMLLQTRTPNSRREVISPGGSLLAAHYPSCTLGAVQQWQYLHPPHDRTLQTLTEINQKFSRFVFQKV